MDNNMKGEEKCFKSPSLIPLLCVLVCAKIRENSQTKTCGNSAFLSFTFSHCYKAFHMSSKMMIKVFPNSL